MYAGIRFLLACAVLARPALAAEQDADDVATWNDSAGQAGASGNYRHQADVCHAYHVLTAGGFEPQHVIVMMYDDIAHHPYNPYPGQLFNCPGCPDVYAGVPKDYTGADVTAWNFFSVLLGNWLGVGGAGTGRVVSSRADDRVFVYYTDHGAPGLLAMPQGPPVYADELLATLAMKRLEGGYRELVFFAEACESGSIFQGMLPDSLNIFAATAANAVESSWATYCPCAPPAGEEPASEGGRPDLQVCLGDLFSVAWIELAEALALDDTPLQLEYLRVQNRTSNNGTYIQARRRSLCPGSHAQEFGPNSIADEAAGDFQGAGLDESHQRMHLYDAAFFKQQAQSRRVSQHDADLVHLELAAEQDSGGLGGTRGLEARDAARGLAKERSRRKAIDQRVRRAVDSLVRQLPDKLGVGDPFDNAGIKAVGDALVLQPVHEGPAGALVKEWSCLREYIAAYEKTCGVLDSYAARHTRAMANLCNACVSSGAWHAAILQQCGSPR